MDSLRSILVHLDGGRHAAARLSVAHSLAARHEAQVQALCSVLPVPQDLAMLHRQQARAHFDRVAAAGAWPMQWEAPTDEQPIPVFTRRALHADLVVLGLHDPGDDGASTVPRHFAESVMLDSGTPALVVPHGPAASGRFDVVLVAWRPDRESARALRAALPVLQQAEEVHLATWMDDLDAAGACQQAVAEQLRLHAVENVLSRRGPVPHDAGAALLTLAAGIGAQLLVMGCYGHAPTRELLLGGATRTVLQSMHLPVLMAN
jgi:nucleotide-binding universal stress UspA family protein